MMKARVLVFAGVAAMALASCQKSVSPAENPDAGLRIESNPVELTLTATMGGPGTKVEYSDVSNVLKGTWRVGDKYSGIAPDSSDCITVYFVGLCNPVRAATLKSGSTITVSVSGTGSKSFAKKVITPTKDISLAAGKMYRTSELVLE